MLATQNALTRADLGVGTSAITFFRTLGGATGASVLGAILIDQGRADSAAAVARYGHRLGPLYAFTHGMDRAYLYAVPVAGLAFLLSFLLREITLRDANDDPAGPAVPAPAPAQITNHRSGRRTRAAPRGCSTPGDGDAEEKT